MPYTVVEHPLARHLLSSLRSVDTKPDQFRQLARNLSILLLLEATRSVPLIAKPVTTPIETTKGLFLNQGLAVVPILRAGLSMMDAALSLFPDVAVGYIGLERDHTTALAQNYYCKLPNLAGRFTVCFDPMLATGGSASSALTLLKKNGADQMAMVSVIGAPEGIARVQSDHPEVPIFLAGVDEKLNDQKYIVPGLGDFGDRLYGTT